ncbi:MAG: hypothetical protein K2X34_10360 [Hyphomonadaceae bacterium]|nr:hypothetical protein [Hyphomonadaceae bacterium]MBY0564854.1 hypothetical protein [Hyphomonadaceae bacterium]
MSYIITASELEGLTEQQLRAKRYAILSDLVSSGLTLEECPHIAISLRIIDEAIARFLRRYPKPGFQPR